MSFFVKDEGSNDAVKRVYESLNLVLVGTLIPLDKMPFSSFFSLLPYSWILHHPMQIYLGKYDFNQTILVFAGGIAWCVILFFFAKIIFKAGLKRNEAVGL
jgi:ABC-2 type transport system permease protein